MRVISGSVQTGCDFTRDGAVELPLDQPWQASAKSAMDRRHREGVLFFGERPGIRGLVYHVGACLRMTISLEGLRWKLNRRLCRFSRDPNRHYPLRFP
jgi:hypothetical protein